MRLPLPPLSLPTTLLLAAAALTAVASAGPAAASPSPVNVTVNAGEGLGTIAAKAYGLNSAVWDSQLNAPQTQDLLQQAGVQMLRYPGGSYGDIDNWQDNTAPGGYVAPGTDFDSFMVLARDQAGYLSPPSTPVTFTTSTPSNSTCQVSYAVTQGWGNGFVANISTTNSGPDPIDGWTLAFSFPASSESVSSDWNGTWSETGQAVTVTGLSWNGALAADGGNTVDIGFVGTNNGAYPSPASFTLNGTVCTTTFSS
jgi:cellulase/cellobiase CelA1